MKKQGKLKRLVNLAEFNYILTCTTAKHLNEKQKKRKDVKRYERQA